VQHYARLIARTTSEAGGFHLLTPEALKRVQGYQSRLQAAAKGLEPYLKPGAVTQLLSAINFSQQLPNDSGGIDHAAFTIDALTAKMRELGLPTAFDAPAKAIEGHGLLPEIDGWSNDRPDQRPQPDILPSLDSADESDDQ